MSSPPKGLLSIVLGIVGILLGVLLTGYVTWTFDFSTLSIEDRAVSAVFSLVLGWFGVLSGAFLSED